MRTEEARGAAAAGASGGGTEGSRGGDPCGQREAEAAVRSDGGWREYEMWTD